MTELETFELDQKQVSSVKVEQEGRKTMLDFKDRKNVHAVEYHVNLLAEETGYDYGDCWSDEVRTLMTKIQTCKDEDTFYNLMNELDEEMKREIIVF